MEGPDVFAFLSYVFYAHFVEFQDAHFVVIIPTINRKKQTLFPFKVRSRIMKSSNFQKVIIRFLHNVHMYVHYAESGLQYKRIKNLVKL